MSVAGAPKAHGVCSALPTESTTARNGPTGLTAAPGPASIGTKPPSNEMASDPSNPEASWQQVVAAVAAAAGGAAWVSTVGSAIVGLRLESVDLPVEATVALMSAEHRFVIGAGFLVAPCSSGWSA